MLADAHETMELVPANTTFHPSDLVTNPDAQVIEGNATVNGKTYYLLINDGFYLLAKLGITDMTCVDVQYAGVSEEISRGNTEPEQLKNGKWAYKEEEKTDRLGCGMGYPRQMGHSTHPSLL